MWNSRNGVTPFMILCRHDGCNGSKRHVNWHSDISIPGLKPMGIRWFIDLTLEKYEEDLEIRMNEIELHEGFPVGTLSGEMSREELKNSFLEEFLEGQPDIYDPRQKEVVYDEAPYPGP